MADYAVVDKDFLENGLSKVANSIKAKSGNTEEMAFPDGFEERVNSIPESFWSEEDVINAFTNNRSSITSIKLPDNMTSVAQYAFYGMEKLVIKTLPDTIESIGEYAFRSCESLGLTKLPDSLKTIGSYCFRGASLPITALPENLESIGTYAFLNRAEMIITVIPQSIVTLLDRCFQGCTGLTELTFKGTPTTIEANVFLSCTNLTVINVPWAEGEVANAPWGASNATINYNYVESEE